MRLILVGLLVGCSSSQTNGAGDDTTGPVIDAPQLSMDAHALTAQTLTCQTHTRVENKADGTRTESDTLFALVDGIDPASDFLVETCEYVLLTGGMTFPLYKPFDPACPAGSTCTTSGTAYPSVTNACSWSRGGTFLDGKLYVYCGQQTRNYNASNALTSTSGTTIGVIRLHR